MEYTYLYTNMYTYRPILTPTHTYAHIYIYMYINHVFIHASADGYLGFFQVLAVVNNAALNIGVHVSFRIRVFVFSRYMSKSRIVGSYVALFLAF